MPVVPWDGEPVFGGKTLVLPGSAHQAMTKRVAKRRTGDSPSAVDGGPTPSKTD